MNYEAVFVDWDGTLSNSKYWERWENDPEKGDAYATIQRSLFSSPDARDMMHKWMIGFRSHHSILGHLATRTGLTTEELEEELRYSAENMKLINESDLELVQRLRDIGKQVVIATDNMDVFDKWTVPSLGLHNHFDDILSSHTVQALKGDIHPLYVRSNFFHRYLNDMGIPIASTVLIDNSLDAQRLEPLGMSFKHVTDETPLAYHLQSILNEYE